MPSESKKQTLLQKYEIPVTHLDFDYVKQCKSSKELTRIVKILRSGEEGCYPDLTKCAEDRLRVLKPHSKILRTEDPVIPRSRLNDEELKEYSAPIDEWTVQENSEKGSEIELPPIRKGGKLCSKQKDSTKQTTTSGTSHVAATNYSQWDKYDAEAEILKMDLDIERSKEQAERIDRLNKKKLIEKKLSSYNKLTPIERENLSEEQDETLHSNSSSSSISSKVENSQHDDNSSLLPTKKKPKQVTKQAHSKPTKRPFVNKDEIPTKASKNSLEKETMNFFKGVLPDITKLSGRRLRLFKEDMMRTLNQSLDQQENEFIL